MDMYPPPGGQQHQQSSYPSKYPQAYVQEVPFHGQGAYQPPLRPPFQSTHVVNWQATSDSIASNGYQSQNLSPAHSSSVSPILLQAIAEEYFRAARGLGASASLLSDQGRLEDYYSYISMGLRCLQATLQEWRVPPRQEAAIRLREASILFEETENIREAEETLTKGIKVCERHVLLDFKYSMQHLLVQVMFRQNPRASLKRVEGFIKDAEAYQHTPWIYAFRYLHAFLSITMSSQADTIAALQSLQKISAISKKRGDRAIFVTSSVIEALAHLRSRSSDSIEQAQRAIATARSFQLEEVTSEIPQVLLLVCVIDLACSLTIANISQLKTQLDTLKTMLDQTSGNNNPSETGSFLIPINSRAGSETSNLGGSNIVIAGTDGRLYLKFSWLPSADIYSLACFLSGVTWTHQTSSGHQAERFLREGLTRIAESTTTVCRNPTSLPTLSSQFLWRKSLECHMKIHFILILSLRTEWNSARKLIQELKTIVDAIGPSLSPSIHSFFLYIGGVIYQGNGELENALAVFENPVLREISSGNYGDSMFRCLNDLSTLSAMNSALILRDPAHPEHARWGPLLSSLDPICSNHPNKNIQIAYNLIRASPHTDDENISTVKQKVFLTRALNGAKEVANTQLTCITINFMRFKFFNKTVGEQAEKSSLAGLTQAKKLGDRLWVSVAGGMMASTLEVQGKPDEAQRAIEESLRIAARNPPLLQREMEEECDVP